MNEPIFQSKAISLLFADASRLFRDLIESVQCGIYMADMDGKLFFVNAAFVHILGYDHRNELLGLSLARELYVDPRDREAFLKSMEKTGFVRDYEIRNLRKDGVVVVLSVTSNYIRDEAGKVIGVEGIVYDVTEKKRLEERLLLEKNKLEQILGFDEGIATIHSLDQLVDFIVAKTGEILSARRCSLMLLDEKNSELCIRGAIGLPEELVANTRVKLGAPVAGMVASDGQAVLVPNIEYDQRFKRAGLPGYSSRSFISAPIKVNNKVIGVINAADKGEKGQEPFNELDLKILMAIVREGAVAIENAELYRELEFLSNEDSLTTLGNYRSFVRGLDHEINRAKRYAVALTVALLDIDHFKEVNDTFGHVKANEVLRRMSELFKNSLRSIDMVYRYGGDEFVVILPGTDVPETGMVMERLRLKVEQIFAREKVTLSIGIAGFQPELDRLALTFRADRAMYQAKKEGRNRVCVYGTH